MKPQIIRTTSGDQLVVLARAEYDALVKRAEGEDAGIARIVGRSTAALAAGQDIELPSDVAEAIARGQSPLRAIREWRGMTQSHLGDVETDVGQSTVSALENGTRRGTAAVWRKLSEALRVPIDALLPG